MNTFNQVIRSFDGHWEMVLATLAAMEDRALNKVLRLKFAKLLCLGGMW